MGDREVEILHMTYHERHSAKYLVGLLKSKNFSKNRWDLKGTLIISTNDIIGSEVEYLPGSIREPWIGEVTEVVGEKKRKNGREVRVGYAIHYYQRSKHGIEHKSPNRPQEPGCPIIMQDWCTMHH